MLLELLLLWASLDYPLGGLRHQFQGVDETAFGQFDLKTILALRFRAAQRRLSRFLENGLRRLLIC
jgi:hypothetical protein